MDALAEQRLAGAAVAASALFLGVIGRWVARRTDPRSLSGVDFARIDPRDHARVPRLVAGSVFAIAACHVALAAWLLLAPAPIRPQWLVVLAGALPPLLLVGVLLPRIQGLYRR